MALPAPLQALFDRLQTYNGDAYDATTNPGGFARGGNQKPVDNFIKSVRDLTAFGKGIAGLTSQAEADAAKTAEDRIQTGEDREAAAGSAEAAAGSAGTAKTDADRAAAAAAGVSLPGISAADALKFLQVKPDGSGWQTALVQKASAAQVIAGTDDATFLTPLSSQELRNINRVARTGNVALTKANKGDLIDITSGTFTQAFLSAASLGAGWWCRIENSGTGDITLDPNGSELIDGLFSFIMYPGEVRLIVCTGGAFFSVVEAAFFKVFAGGATFVKPPGYLAFAGLAWGGGGGGGLGTAATTQWGGGGGGGACVPLHFKATDLPASMPVSVGAGGAGAPGNNTGAAALGSQGGFTSLNGIILAYGGGGGGRNSGGSGGGALSAGITEGTIQTQPSHGVESNSVGGNPGFGGGGGANSPSGYPSGASAWGGGGGGAGDTNNTALLGGGGASVYGGGGGGGGRNNANNPGGVSKFGGNGGAGNQGTAAAGVGQIPGGGGGGCYVGMSGGGAGARGELQIWGVI